MERGNQVGDHRDDQILDGCGGVYVSLTFRDVPSPAENQLGSSRQVCILAEASRAARRTRNVDVGRQGANPGFEGKTQ